jgi:hypothetical protein
LFQNTCPALSELDRSNSDFLAVPHEYHTPNAKKQSMDAEIAITLPKNVTNRGVTQLLRCNAD